MNGRLSGWVGWDILMHGQNETGWLDGSMELDEWMELDGWVNKSGWTYETGWMDG